MVLRVKILFEIIFTWNANTIPYEKVRGMQLSIKTAVNGG